MILVKDDMHIPRGHWRLGKVDELTVGRDGSTCEAKLTVFSKISVPCYRPVQKIIPY